MSDLKSTTSRSVSAARSMAEAGSGVLSGTETPAVEQSKLRSDVGTVVLHWLTALSMIASLLTGLRISADGLHTTWAQALDPILPQGQVWTWHLVASLVLFFCTAAYFIYVRRARLWDRNSSARLRTLTPPTNKRLQLRAINVALHWFAYAAIAVLTLSGILLYVGYGGVIVTAHKALAWAMLFYIAVHTLTHFLYGGIQQLLRLFRPQMLAPTAAMRTFPLAFAVSIGIVVTGAAWAIDQTTKQTLQIAKIDAPPTMDGKLDDAVWNQAPIVTVQTQQGANLGGSGTSAVSVQAVRTAERIYFAYRWQDPTRSLMRSPLIKREDGWHVMSTGAAQADVNDYYEDKFAVLFAHADKAGGSGSTYLGKDPLPAHAKSPHGRGLHYTDDGRILDLWQWKSSRGGMLGHVDDMHFGPPKTPTAAQKAGKSRYAAGYREDPGKKIYEYNYIADGPDGYDGPVRVKRLPADLVANRIALGTIPADADQPNDQGSQWWMTWENSVAYDAGLDAAIPVGTIIPATLNIHTYAGDRADLSAGARWADGHWTLEVSRKLDTGSAFDVAFQPGTTLYSWVSVFDHNQTRHTRHQRPLVLKIE